MIRRMGALLVSALMVAVVSASPAAATTTGEVVIDCDMRFPAFPSPDATGDCRGTSLVSVGGVDDLGTPYALAGPAAFHMFVTYSAACIAGEPPVLWTAAGRIEVGPVLAVRGGVVTQASLAANVVITGTPEEFTFQTGGHSVVFADGASASGSTGFGEASMTFVPSAANLCPVGGSLSASANGRWHLAS